MVLNRPARPDAAPGGPALILVPMEPDDGLGDDGPRPPLLPPDDRLWRHPSEVAAHGLPAARRPSRRPARRLAATSALGGLVAALLFGGLVAVGGGLGGGPAGGGGPPGRVIVPVSAGAGGAAGPTALRRLADRLRPALVALEVEGGPGPRHGSGVAIHPDGHVLTAGLVVAGATRITVVTAGGRRRAAELVGADGDTDLAVVRTTGWDGPTAPLGSRRAVVAGQEVVAVGAAAGPGSAWSAVGVVVGVGRRVERAGGAALLDMIEFDAPPAPTAVGGPLVDATGAVVGITTVAAGSATGLATPAPFARHVAERLVAAGRVAPAWLGVEAGDGGGGAEVREVREGSPARRAGLAAGDVITAVGATPVTSMASLRLALRWHDPGDAVVVALRRAGEARFVRVHLAERPPGR